MFILTYSDEQKRDHTQVEPDYAFADVLNSIIAESGYEIINVVHLPERSTNRAEIQHAAIEYSNAPIADLSWYEYAEITGYFHRYGKRYGLLKEFHENGIC